jgi:hypothetical protein
MPSLTPHHLPKFTGHLPERLFWEVKRGSCVLFAGAGLSSQVARRDGRPLPGWGALLSELADMAREDGCPITDDLVQTIRKGQLLEAGQELHQLVSDSSLTAYLTRVFADPAIRPSPAHVVLPAIRLRAVLTTNYDTLIEDAYRDATGTLPLTMTYADYASGRRDPIRNGDFFVYKIHGDYRDVSSIALGTRSYQDLIHWNPGYRFLLESVFAAYTVLFIGFGGSDPDITHVLDALAAWFPGRSAMHYSLLPGGRWTDTEKRRAREDRGLELIEYDDRNNHIQVGAFLQQLATGEPERDGRLRIALTVGGAVEPAAGKLRSVLDAGQYKVAALDLDRTSQAGWFDDLRAEIELCDVVIALLSGDRDSKHDLVEWVAKGAERPVIHVIAGGEGTPSSHRGGSQILAAADGLWLGVLLEQLKQVRAGIDMRE